MNISPLDVRSEKGWLPADLLIVVCVTIALNVVVFVPEISSVLLRVVIGSVFVFFAPGYVVVAALFPAQYRDGNSVIETVQESNGRTPVMGSGVTFNERLLLSVGVSIVVLPMLGYLFNFTQWGVRLTPILLAVSAFTVLGALVAGIRRQQLPVEDRFHPRPVQWTRTAGSNVLDRDSRQNYAINVILVASLLFFAVAGGYAVDSHSSHDQFSEIYLLTEDGDRLLDGESATQIEPDARNQITVGVSNHEEAVVNYTVVAVQQRLEVEGNRTVVRDQTRLGSFETSLRHEQTETREYTFTPSQTDGNSRIVWLLYTERAPEDPSTESAENYVYLWVDDRS